MVIDTMITTIELTEWSSSFSFGTLSRLVRLTIDDAARTTSLAVDEIGPYSPPDRCLGAYRYDKGIGIRPAYFDLPYEEGMHIAGMISSIELSLKPAHGFEIEDGASYTLSISCGNNLLHLKWKRLDGEWSKLTEVVSKLEQYLKLLPKPEVPLDVDPPPWIAKLLRSLGQDDDLT